MTQTSSENTNELVLPEKLSPAFHNAVVTRVDASVLDKPKTFSGKVKRLARKSTFVTGLTTIFGTIALDEYIDTTVQFADPFSPVAVSAGIIAITISGFAAFAVGLDSTILGSGKYTPLPPSKRYLELEASNRKSSIAPFDAWDSVFKKNSACTSGE